MSRNVRSDAGSSPRLAHALQELADDSDGAVAELSRMVAIDTSFPPAMGYVAFAELVGSLVEPLGFETRHIDVPEHLWKTSVSVKGAVRRNLIAERKTGKPTCGLYFHVDTVPAAPGWRRDPLRLTQEGSRLYGLGTADMKGTIAAVLMALRAAARNDVELAYNPMLLFCTDEECGLYPGIRYLAEQGHLRGHILNFNGSAAPRIWAGCFGVFNLLVRIRGEGVHAGEGNRSSAGTNAIERALPFLAGLQELKSKVSARVSSLPPPPSANGPLRSQISIAAAKGGTAGGQVPSLFEILVSRRYAPEEEFESALAEIRDLLAETIPTTDGLTVETEIVGHLVPTADPDGPHWPRWTKALAEGFDYRPEEFSKWGASSCSDFGWVQRSGVMQEVLLSGLGRPGNGVHSPDEHTTIEDIVALATSVLAYLAADFAPELIPETTSLPSEG
ncbi:MAG: M20/M25/M40 family metallo-hydrolase [Rhizobiales bacterium]|nr:M20/M25/M40 family metallo-hydrolase [Hyphomicrobiales bacterium]